MGVNEPKKQSHLDTMTASVNTALRAIADLSREIELAREHAGRVQPRTHYSIDEAAEALGVSRSTIRRRLADGTLSSAKIGGRRLIRALELELAGVA